MMQNATMTTPNVNLLFWEFACHQNCTKRRQEHPWTCIFNKTKKSVSFLSLSLYLSVSTSLSIIIILTLKDSPKPNLFTQKHKASRRLQLCKQGWSARLCNCYLSIKWHYSYHSVFLACWPNHCDRENRFVPSPPMDMTGWILPKSWLVKCWWNH